MPAIANPRHEKFCQLLCDGRTYTEAYKILYPNNTAPGQSGYNLAKLDAIKARVEELREEVALRSIMTLSRKREVLRQMAEGMIPTKTFNKDTGETFDALQALLADARIAGEFAPDKLQVEGTNLKIKFDVPDRNSREVIDITPVTLPEQTEPSADVTENWDSAPPSLSDSSPEA